MVQYLKKICSFELKSAVLFRKMKSQLHQFIQLGCLVLRFATTVTYLKMLSLLIQH